MMFVDLKDRENAKKYLKQASDAGNNVASFAMAKLYQEGKVFRNDQPKSRKYFELAA